MILPCQRALFDIPDHVCYLNCAYLSPLMKAVVEAGQQGVLRRAAPWRITAPDFFNESDSLRNLVARLIGSTADDVAIIPAVSYGIATAARNLPIARGQSILVSEEQFPSNFYPWRERAREVGAEVRIVPRPGNGDWTSSVLDALDERTAVVALPQCHWTDGGFFDLELIGKHCRERGACLVVDASQSLGALPFDVQKVQPDFLAAVAYKWLLGPYSLGFLYVSKPRQEGSPIEHSWHHRRNAENFARLVDYQDEFAAGARRFDVGERANFGLLPMAAAALRRILDWGVQDIAETIRLKTEHLTDELGEQGFESPHRRAGHFFSLRLPENVSPDLQQRLADQDIYVSVRGSSLRVTPHLYTTDRDLDRFVTALRKALP